jgi:hypothetical protein
VVTVLSAEQYLEKGQEYDNENRKYPQQKKPQTETRSLVLQEFPHLETRYDQAIAECILNMDNNVKSVNEFFELSNDLLKNRYLDHPHIINESPCQDIISARKLENSALTEYTCNVCLLKFYILGQVEEHCVLVEPYKHKQAILSIIYRSGIDSLAEINQRYESDICEFATVIAQRRAT